jgi:hypothetical protein
VTRGILSGGALLVAAADAGTSGNMTIAKQFAATALMQARVAARFSG